MAYKRRGSIGAVFGTPEKKFQPAEAEWQRLQKIYERSLDAGLRRSITRGVKEYIVEAEMERDTPTLDEAGKRLKEISVGAGNFASTLATSAVGDGTDASEHSDMLIRQLLDKYLREAGGSRRNFGFQDLYDLMADVQVACDNAKSEITGREPAAEGYAEGDAWRSFIRRLAKALEESGFTTTARQDTDKSHDEKNMSPFVRFVSELQKFLPEEHRRGGHSLNALSKRIQRALSDK